MPAHQATRPQLDDDGITAEVEVIPGLEAFAARELTLRLRQHVTLTEPLKEGLLPFTYRGDLAALLDLDTVLAVYGQRWFPIPRPKALLGNAEFTILLRMIDQVRALHPVAAFQTFRISAAGEDSAVLVRLRERIAAETGLTWTGEEGDLLLRLRRPLDGSDGWDALLRLSPRPLSVRPWRVCNLPGALNATVAAVMAALVRPHADDAVLNLACGSGSLAIERLRQGPARLAIGCDTDPAALFCAAQNQAASGFTDLRLEGWDVGALPIPDSCIDELLVDLPFGQLVGSHVDNAVLYPRLLREAARVAVGGALCAAITQDIRRWEQLVADSAADWTLEATLPIKLPFARGYLYPRIYLLRRKG